MSRVYLASSWRNSEQPAAVHALRQAGHKVYDFRNPPGGIEGGFRWSEIDPAWPRWTAAQYRENLQTPLAQRGFNSDFDGMKWADVGVLLLPCGRSAHLELGWMAGAGKRTVVWTHDGEEPELMALLATTICVSLEEVLDFLEAPDAVLFRLKCVSCGHKQERLIPANAEEPRCERCQGPVVVQRVQRKPPKRVERRA